MSKNLILIRECEMVVDGLVKQHLSTSEIDSDTTPIHKKALKKNKQTPCIDLQKYSFQYFGGVDLFAIQDVNQKYSTKFDSRSWYGHKKISFRQSPFLIGFICAQIKR